MCWRACSHWLPSIMLQMGVLHTWTWPEHHPCWSGTQIAIVGQMVWVLASACLLHTWRPFCQAHPLEAHQPSQPQALRTKLMMNSVANSSWNHLASVALLVFPCPKHKGGAIWKQAWGVQSSLSQHMQQSIACNIMLTSARHMWTMMQWSACNLSS